VPEAARAPGAGSALPARLGGRRLRVARAAWLVVVVGSLALAAAGLARGLTEPELITPQAMLSLSSTIGVTIPFLVLGVAAPLVVVVGVGAVVFWRRSDDPMALLFTATLVALYVAASRGLLAFGAAPFLRHSITIVSAVALVGLALVLASFPDGRFTPRSAVWLAPGMLVVALIDGGEIVMRLPDVPVDVAPWRVGGTVAGFSGIVLLGLLAQVHRYRHVSGATERLQTKWVMAPIALLVGLVLALAFIPVTFLGASERWIGWVVVVTLFIGMVLPPMVANAVLRYRLYEIDRIVSRTVSYGVVVAVLATVYVIGVLGVGAVVSSARGQATSELMVAVSTLAAAALFRPVRRRVQMRVDRRFNRTGYEARKVVVAFSQGLRDRVDLDEISAGLVAASVQALEPSHASVWLPRRP
jgi:hypothetical protein